jgi:hypothetical protein
VAIKETLDTLFLCWFSQPKADRALYRCVREKKIRTIVELGMASTERTLRLLKLAKRLSPGAEIHFAGIDLFEARPADQAPMKLKKVHQSLAHCGATVRLIPGDPLSALARTANQLAGTQLLVIDGQIDAPAMAQAWTFVPRILAEGAIILEANGQTASSGFRLVSSDDVRQRAEQAARIRRLAA